MYESETFVEVKGSQTLYRVGVSTNGTQGQFSVLPGWIPGREMIKPMENRTDLFIHERFDEPVKVEG